MNVYVKCVSIFCLIVANAKSGVTLGPIDSIDLGTFHID